MKFTTRSLLLAVLALCIAASSGVSAADTCCCINGTSSDMPSGGQMCKMLCGDDGEMSCSSSTDPGPVTGDPPATDPSAAGDDSKCHGNPTQPLLTQRWFETPSAKGCPGDSCSAQKGGDMWTCTCDSMAQCEAAWKRVQAAGGGGGGDQPPPKKDEPKDPAGCLLVGKKWKMTTSNGEDAGSVTVTSLTSVHISPANVDLPVHITRKDKYLFNMIIKGVKNNPDAAKAHCDVDAEYGISFASYKCDEFKMLKQFDECTVRRLADQVGKLASSDDDSSSNTTTIIIVVAVVAVLVLGIILTVFVLKSKQKAAQTAMLMQEGGTGAYAAPQ